MELAGANAITEIFNRTLNGIAIARKWIAQKRVEAGVSASKYRDGIRDRYGSMKIFFRMSEPIPLDHIYVKVNILRKNTSHLTTTRDELERLFDRDTKSFGFRTDTVDGLDVINNSDKVIVLGKPGAGKTTFLKYLATQAINGNLMEDVLPIFISLKNWSDSGESLFNFIVQEFDVCGFPDAKPFVRKVLKEGECLILFDGLDEISKNRRKAIRSLVNFTEKYRSNKMVISCRVAAYNYIFQSFRDVEMADFDSEQQKQFIENWFKDDTSKAEGCIRSIKEEPGLAELASVPLLLTMLCLSYDENIRYPKNRAQLYDNAIDAFLSKWDNTRNIE